MNEIDPQHILLPNDHSGGKPPRPISFQSLSSGLFGGGLGSGGNGGGPYGGSITCPKCKGDGKNRTWLGKKTDNPCSTCKGDGSIIIIK